MNRQAIAVWWISVNRLAYCFKSQAGSGTASGRKPRPGPAGTVARITQPIMQPRGPSLPELENRWADAVSAPKRRSAGVRPMAQAHLRGSREQPGAARDLLALRRGPRADAACQGAAAEVGVGLVARNAPDGPLDAHLAFEFTPEKKQRRERICRQFVALAAFVIGEENEAGCVESF